MVHEPSRDSNPEYRGRRSLFRDASNQRACPIGQALIPVTDTINENGSYSWWTYRNSSQHQRPSSHAFLEETDHQVVSNLLRSVQHDSCRNSIGLARPRSLGWLRTTWRGKAWCS